MPKIVLHGILRDKVSLLRDLYDDAIFCYDKTINISNYNGAWIKRGNALDKIAKYDEAVESFNKALEIDPKSSDAWYYKGESLVNSENTMKR